MTDDVDCREQLRAALGWPGGISRPAMPWVDLLQAVARMRGAAEDNGKAGFSWDGFNINGDARSVREVRRLVEFHAARRVEAP